jgi:hypothetical protein
VFFTNLRFSLSIHPYIPLIHHILHIAFPFHKTILVQHSHFSIVNGGGLPALLIFSLFLIKLFCTMYRAIITPKETTLTIELPDQLVGKSVEVIAFEIENQSLRKKPTKKEINLFYATYQVDMKGFKFNRDEANER